MKSAKLMGPDVRIRATRRSASVRPSCAPAGRTRWSDLRRARRVVSVERDLFRWLPRPRDGELLFREYGAAEAAVRRELEVRGLAECTVRADLDAVAAVDAPSHVQLVRLQIALAHHQRARRARLRARPARDAVGVLERDEIGRASCRERGVAWLVCVTYE